MSARLLAERGLVRLGVLARATSGGYRLAIGAGEGAVPVGLQCTGPSIGKEDARAWICWLWVQAFSG